MACYLHKFRRCTTEGGQTCAVCCAQEAECGNYYIEDLVGSTGNIQIGDKVWLTAECSGETAPDGIYTDCGPKGDCGNTYTYGCVTVASGLVTAIAACSGDVSCGDGPQSNCPQSSTINTNTKHGWAGRQKVTVSALDTWETLYESITGYDIEVTDSGTCYTANTNKISCFIKQIYIQNCDKGGTNEKKFSVRIYNATTGTFSVSDCNITATTIPAEVSLADRIKLSDNARIKILEHESPLKLGPDDVVQIQAHTSLDGWVISGWFEQTSQNYEQEISALGDNVGVNSGVGIVGAMSGLSRRLGKRSVDKRFKPGGGGGGEG